MEIVEMQIMFLMDNEYHKRFMIGNDEWNERRTVEGCDFERLSKKTDVMIKETDIMSKKIATMRKETDIMHKRLDILNIKDKLIGRIKNNWWDKFLKPCYRKRLRELKEEIKCLQKV